MGNLNNLYISASFQSLLHLGNDSIISSSLVGIQDGFGNSVGIAVNSAGDLSLSGSLTASLQQGYVWVGNSVNKTVLVPTSSFAGGGSATWPVSGTPSGIVSGSSQLTSSYDSRYALSGSINLTSLNQFTASQETKNSTLATYTGSVNTQLTNLSTSQSIDNQKWINISTQSGSWGGGGTINTGSFATTGSNVFVGEQYINGGRHLQIERSSTGPSQYLRLGPTDNENNFAFIVTGSGQNPGQQVWGINVGGGIWANSFDGGVAFNNYVSASNGIQIGRGTDDEGGRNALNISRQSAQTGIQINQTGVGASWFIGTRENNNGNLIISSSAQDRYIEFVSSSGWIEVNSQQTNFNGNVSLRSRTDARNIFTDLGNGYTAQFDIISGSNANISGSLYVGGNKQFNVGAFQSNITQSGSANVSQSMQFEVTDISKGVSIASNSRITLANSGTYNIQFSSQFDRVTGSGNDTVYVWLKKNGVNYNSSAGVLTVSGGANQAKALAAWNYVVESTSSDYWELCWQTSDTNIKMITFPASGNIPAVPSVILTVTQVK